MTFKGKIAVLKGGYSDERTISLKTSENVEQALKELGLRYVSIDCKDDFVEKLISSNFDLCFNALHGEFGEEKKWTELEFFKSDYIASKDVNAWLGLYEVTK